MNDSLEAFSISPNDTQEAKLVSEILMPKSFVCMFCQEKHFSEELLMQHDMLHHSKYYHCFYCSFKSLKISFLLQHVKQFNNHHQLLCTVCSFTCRTDLELIIHLLSHSSPLPFKCFHCDLKFRCRRDWSKHLLGHSENAPFSCDHCLEKFKTSYLRRMHELKMHPKEQYICEECGYSTRFPAYLKKHKLKHNENHLQCSVIDCNFKTVYKESLKLHAMSHKNKVSVSCPDCGIDFKYEKNLRRHMFSFHRQHYTYKCTECDFQSERAEKVKEHFSKLHDSNVLSTGSEKISNHFLENKYSELNNCVDLASFECYHCSECYNSKELLKRHILVLHSKLYHCIHCDFTSSNMFWLEEHINSNKNHNETVCSFCLFEAKDIKGLSKHFSLHEYPLPYVCSLCGKRYKTRRKWREHLRIHKEEQNIPKDSFEELRRGNGLNRCHECDYVTKFPSYLKRHVLKHKKVLLHCTASNSCPYTTEHASYMRRHLKRHKQKISSECNTKIINVESGKTIAGSFEKLTCPECGVTFKHNKNLMRHKESHSSQFVFSCARCPYNSPRQDKVRDHCKKHHRNFRSINIIKKVLKDEFNFVDKSEELNTSVNEACSVDGMSKIKISTDDCKVADFTSSSNSNTCLMSLKDFETHLDEYTGVLSFVYEISPTDKSLPDDPVMGSLNTDIRSESLNNLVAEEPQGHNSSSCEAGNELSFLSIKGSSCLQTLLDEVTGEITTLKEFPTQETTESTENLSDTVDLSCDIDFMNDDSLDGFDELDDFIFETESHQGNSDSVIRKILNEETGEMCLETQIKEHESCRETVQSMWGSVEKGFNSESKNVFSELFLDEVTGEISFQT